MLNKMIGLTFLIAWILVVPDVAHAVAIDHDGNLIGDYVVVPQPCYGSSCYAPCQQAAEAENNVSPAAKRCLDSCFLAEGPVHPKAFIPACLSCASQDVDCAIRLGLYTSCNAANNLISWDLLVMRLSMPQAVVKCPGVVGTVFKGSPMV